MMWRPQNASEISRCPWVVEEGVYHYTARFEDWNALYQPSNEAGIFVVAEVVPVSVLFVVQPRKFRPRDDITLIATVFDAASGLPLPDAQVRFYVVDDTGNASPIGSPEQTNVSGVATFTCPYHIGPNAYFSNASVAQTVIMSPVMLTVAKATRLLLAVTRDESSSDHVIHGWLKWGSSGVNGKQVRVKINETEYSLATNASGHFSLSLNLQPKDNLATVYMVTASFEDYSQPLNATAWAYTLDGQRFAACTTFQYGYKPASNTTSLTVNPQATQVMTPTKTPEEMQQEAEDSGWLSTWHEFSWWYPWYRLHIKININPVVDVGFNPLLPGGGTWNWEGLEIFAEVLEEVWQDIMLDFIGVFISYIVAKGFSIWNLAAGLIAEGVKGTVQYGLFFVEFFKESSGSSKMLAIGIANILMGLIAILTNVGEAFVKALQNIIFAPALSAIMITTTGMIALAAPLQVVRTPVDYVESFVIDFPIAILALLRYLGRI